MYMPSILSIKGQPIVNILQLENQHPISLLNCDHKIATKAIANRLKRSLPTLINNEQTGFVKGGFIRENIRVLYASINYTAMKNIPGLLLRNLGL